MSRKYPPTPEQKKIIDYKGRLLVVSAYAGTGKTTTLVQFALANPGDRMLYIAYNRSIKEEASQKFPRNVDCKTAHGLAFAAIGRMYTHKLAANIKLKAIAEAADTRNYKTAQAVLDTLNNFLCSADTTISELHFPLPDDGLLLSDRQKQYQYQVIEAAKVIWNRMVDPEDSFPTTHDTYLKQYQLSKPDLSKKYSWLLLDEAQDTNPVTASFVLSQQCKIVLVGDEHQMLYRFRGADDALNHPSLKNADRMFLTNSFRFGPSVALVANALLELKGETRPVVGRGQKDNVLLEFHDNSEHIAILCRTVAGVIVTAITGALSGNKIYWVGGIEAYNLQNISDVYWLAKGNTGLIKNKALLAEYPNYEHYCQQAKALADFEMLRTLMLIKQQYDIPQVLSLIQQQTVNEESQSDLTVSTGHRSKGLEWLNVAISEDFPDIFDPEMPEQQRNDEINLLYVAATRSQKNLIVNSVLQDVIKYVTHKRLKEKSAV